MDILILKKGDKNKYITRTGAGELVLRYDDGQKTELCTGMTEDYDAYIGGDGSIDIFGINTESNLVHIRCLKGETITRTVLESRSKNGRISGVRVYMAKGRFHLFYCIDHTDRLLVHHIVGAGDYTQEPLVIDRIGEKKLYDAVKDEDGNFHILYAGDGTLLRRKYTYSTKSYSPPETVGHYDIRSLSALYTSGKLYGAFTAVDNGRVSVYVCDTAEKTAAEAGIKVHIRTQVALLPEGDGLLVQWVENSMCFAVPCSPGLEKERVRILGRSPGLARPKLPGGETAVSGAALNLSRQLFGNVQDIALPEEPARFEPVGQEVDMLSRKYIEVLSRKNDFVDFERELTRIEASLEKLVMLAEKALGEAAAPVSEQSIMTDTDKEEQ